MCVKNQLSEFDEYINTLYKNTGILEQALLEAAIENKKDTEECENETCDERRNIMINAVHKSYNNFCAKIIELQKQNDNAIKGYENIRYWENFYGIN